MNSSLKPSVYRVKEVEVFSSGILILIWLANFLMTPFIGVVIWLIMREKQPQKARQAGMSSIVAFGIHCMLFVLMVLFFVFATARQPQ